jgi:hypothetical protein
MKRSVKKLSLFCLILIFATATFLTSFASAQPSDNGKGKEIEKNTVSDDVYGDSQDSELVITGANEGNVLFYEESHPNIHYTGSSKELHSSHYSGGTTMRMNPNSSAELTFTGNKITWISTLDKNYGTANVYIDGQLVHTPSLHSSNEMHQQIIFEANLDYGTHTIKIEPAGNRGRGNNGNPHINLDAFIVVAEKPHEPPTAPTGLTAQVEDNLVLLTWDAHSSANLAGYNTYRYDPQQDSWFKLNDTLIIDTAYVDTDVITGSSYIYAITAVDTKESESVYSELVSVEISQYTVTRVEETDSGVVYSGTWGNSSVKQASNESIKYSGQGGASTSLTFTGHGIRVIALTNPYYGLVDVYINDQLVGEINLYSSSTQYQQVVFEKLDLPSGTHTIKLVNKRKLGHPDAISFNINIDAFDVLYDKLNDEEASNPVNSSITRVEEADSRIVSSGSWGNSNINQASKKAIKYSGQGGASTSLTFNGHGIRAIALKNPYYGLVDVYINDQLVGEINLYSSSTQYQQVVFEKLDLPFGTHTIKLVNKRKLGHPDALSYNINLDAFDIIHDDAVVGDTPVSSIITRAEETDSRVVLSGTWGNSNANQASQGSIIYSGQGGASASFTFTGHGIRVIALTNPYYGLVDVYINDQLIGEINLYSATTQYQQVVFEKLDLPSGTHTIKLVNKRKLGHPDALSFNINIDAFDIFHDEQEDVPVNSIITRTEETNSGILFSGTWGNSNVNQASEGAITYSGQGGASAEFTFTGHGIRVLALTNPYYGLVDVYINDQLIGEINLYSSSTQYQQAVFEKLDLPSGTHTIKLVNKRKLGHPDALSFNINIDAFDVFN